MKHSKALTSMAAAACVLLPVSSAAASPRIVPASPTEITVHAANRDGLQSTATVTFSKRLSSTAEQTVRKALSSANAGNIGSSPSLLPPPGTSYKSLYCNHSYVFTDADGSFYYQHACGGTTAPWAFHISSGWRSIIYTYVKEDGMEESINGGAYHRMAAHVEPSWYSFHGTFNPIRARYYLGYIDHFSFGVIIDGNPGEASMYISGNIRQVS